MTMPEEQALRALYESDVQTPGARPAPALPDGAGPVRSGRTVHAGNGTDDPAEARPRPAGAGSPPGPPSAAGPLHVPVLLDADFDAIVTSAVF
jgi:hypothetical protein